MTLHKPTRLLPPEVTYGQSLTVKQSSAMQLLRPIALTLMLIASLLLITLLTASLARAQDVPPAPSQHAPPAVKPIDTKPSLSNETPQRQPKRANRWAPKAAPLEAQPAPAAVPSPAVAVPAETTTAAPQPADDRLPFMATNERDNHEQPPSAAGLLLRTLGALLLIVGLIVAAAWGMKRFGGARFGTPQENAPSLAVLNSLSLGDRRSLTIVKFGDRTLLLGSTAHSVTLLAESETDELAPPARSVADILNDEKPAAFSQELLSATELLDEQLKARRASNSTT